MNLSDADKLLSTPVRYLHGVGEHRERLLTKELNIRTYGDLLYHFPYKHIDRTRIYKSVELTPHLPYIQLKGVITGFRTEGTGSRKRLVGTFRDPYGTIELVWFNQITYFAKLYTPMEPIVVFGRPSLYGCTME